MTMNSVLAYDFQRNLVYKFKHTYKLSFLNSIRLSGYE